MRSHERSEGSIISLDLLRNFAYYLILALEIAVFLRAMLSWFPMDQRSPIIRILDDINEPILAPLRKIVPRIGMIDITPMVAILVLFVIQQAVSGL